MESNTTASVQL